MGTSTHRHGLAAAHGAAAGAVASGAMTVFMRGAQRAGALGRLPPRIITADALDAAGIRRSENEERALGLLNHFLFGAVMGAVYGALVRRSTVTRGMAFGCAVWLVSYWGWVPALGILPAPPEDRPRRPPTMIAAHCVFGGALGALLANRR